MTEQQAQQRADDKEQPASEPGPTEKLRDRDPVNADLAVPGAQDPESEIKEEINPNTE